MIAFFMWGFIVDDSVDEAYKSHQFQINDSVPLSTNNASSSTTSRKQIKKEAASVSNRQRDKGAVTTVTSPFRHGMTVTQQIEVAKLEAAKFLEERRLIDNEFSQEMTNIQDEIDNRIELAKLWGVTDRQDPLFLEIRELMDQKKELSLSFKQNQAGFNAKQQRTDKVMQQAFIAAPTPANKRSRLSLFADDGTSYTSSCTPSSINTHPPRSVVLYGGGGETTRTPEVRTTSTAMQLSESCPQELSSPEDDDNHKEN
jgi:hypothetical protein